MTLRTAMTVYCDRKTYCGGGSGDNQDYSVLRCDRATTTTIAATANGVGKMMKAESMARTPGFHSKKLFWLALAAYPWPLLIA